MCNNCSFPSFNIFSNFAFRWTPRIVVSTVAGYYSLGVAYERGVMALIDRVAIQILLPRVGYLGLGAVMPTVQWYAAWAVRIAVTIAVALLYDLCERMLIAAYRRFCAPSPKNQVIEELTTKLTPAPATVIPKSGTPPKPEETPK